MSIRQENERLNYKVLKQQEDIDYLREIIADLKTELAIERSKKRNDDERAK